VSQVTLSHSAGIYEYLKILLLRQMSTFWTNLLSSWTSEFWKWSASFCWRCYGMCPISKESYSYRLYDH